MHKRDALMLSAAFAIMLFLSAGCSTVTREFTVITDPPGAEIKVTSCGREPQTYRSPATITVGIPKDRSEAGCRLDIAKETYRTKSIALATMGEDTIKVRLEKAVLYRLKYRLLRPIPAEEPAYADKIVAIRLVPGERGFELTLENRSRGPLRILWDRSEYIDYMNGHDALVHQGAKADGRGDYAAQLVPAGGSLQDFIFPKTSVAYSRIMKNFSKKLLFPVDTEAAPALKGRTFSVFLPIEADRVLIPDYYFKFEIVDVVKEQ